MHNPHLSWLFIGFTVCKCVLLYAFYSILSRRKFYTDFYMLVLILQGSFDYSKAMDIFVLVFHGLEIAEKMFSS